VVTFSKVGRDHEKLILHRLALPSTNSPDEIILPQQYAEDTCHNITVNAYERNAAARDACLAHYGLSCQVCAFNYKERYGELGVGFIHVHHIVPLADIGEENIVDPVNEFDSLVCQLPRHDTSSEACADS